MAEASRCVIISSRRCLPTNVMTAAGLHNILIFAPTNCTVMPGGFAACMSYGLYTFLADIHNNSSTVLFYRLHSVLLCVCTVDTPQALE